MRRMWALLWIVAATASASTASAQIRLAPERPPESAWPRFVCEDGSCPAGVGALITFRADGRVGFCTATLIAPDRIVTAAHCLLHGRGDAMHFFLPDERGITITWRAAIDVVHEEPRDHGADHALVRLDRAIDEPHALLARRAPVPDGTLVVVRATPHADRTVFVRSERCLVMPQALGADRDVPSAIVRIAGCTILPGNSGGPMLDRDGRVVAVVSSALDPPGVAVLLAPWLTGPAPFVGTISSIACMPRRLAPGSLPDRCRWISRSPDSGVLRADDALHAAIDVQQEALADRLVEWDASDREDAIGWDLERAIDGVRTVAIPTPACVDVHALEREDRIDARGRFSVSLVVPAWEARSLLGSDLRMIPRTARIARVRLRIRGRLDPDRMAASIRVRASGGAGTHLPRLSPPERIPACAD